MALGITDISAPQAWEAYSAGTCQPCVRMWKVSYIISHSMYRAQFDHFCLAYLHALCFRGNKKTYLHFVSFLHIDMTQVVEILPQVRQELIYSTLSISWVLMPWWCKEPRHQQPRYWLCWTELIWSPHVNLNDKLLYLHITTHPRVLAHMCWLHFGQKRLVARPRGGNNGPDNPQYG